jgi:hypothetical protein
VLFYSIIQMDCPSLLWFCRGNMCLCITRWIILRFILLYADYWSHAITDSMDDKGSLARMQEWTTFYDFLECILQTNSYSKPTLVPCNYQSWRRKAVKEFICCVSGTNVNYLCDSQASNAWCVSARDSASVQIVLESQCTYRSTLNIEELRRNHCYRAETISITYS